MKPYTIALIHDAFLAIPGGLMSTLRGLLIAVRIWPFCRSFRLTRRLVYGHTGMHCFGYRGSA